MRVDFVEEIVGQCVADAPYVLHLFNGPYVTSHGQRIAIPEGGTRLLAFVALHRGPVERSYAAGTLWPGGDDERASGNLRSTLWRLRRAHACIVVTDRNRIALGADIIVDAHVWTAWALRMIQNAPSARDLDFAPGGIERVELLPGWHDDWVVSERERIRQRLLHALEALSRQLARVDRCAEAVDAAMAAVRAEPLRESAHRALIDAHIAEGNWAEARRSYTSYCELLRQEIGAPTGGKFAAVSAVPATSTLRGRPALR